MFTRTRYTKQEFINAVKTSKSISQVLEKLNLGRTGGNYRYFNKRVKILGLDISHFTGEPRSYSKSVPKQPKYTLEEILVSNSSYSSQLHLKKRLLSENLLEYSCSLCSIDSWLGNPLTLQLDHINGINNDNRISNLRLLCPNCHSQTPTFAGRNISRKKINKLCSCGQEISPKAKKCKSCYLYSRPSKTKISWPPAHVILTELETKSYSALGRELGVSDNAIRKHLKNKLGRCPSKQNK